MSTFIIFAGLLLLFCVTYLMVSSAGDANKKRLAEKESQIEPVQCPKCQRWKAISPIEVKDERAQRVDVATGAYHPGVAHRVMHTYKCAFCGHRWDEQFESRTG